MSATTAGAIKAYVESLGLGLTCYRDGAPAEDTSPPFVVITEGVGMAPAPQAAGDYGDLSAPLTVIEQVQVDYYWHARALDGGPQGSRNAEPYVTPDALWRALHGAQLPAVGSVTPHGCRVSSRVRWPITNNVGRHTYTLSVHRDLQGLPS